MFWKKRILLISHELSYTGAPKALLELAKILKKLEYEVYLAFFSEGELKDEFEKIGVKILWKNERKILKNIFRIKFFDLVICNTIVCHNTVNALTKWKINTLWWLHEAFFFNMIMDTYTEKEKKRLIKALKTAKNIFCVSEYSKDFFAPYNSNIQILEPYVNDNYSENPFAKESTRIDKKIKIAYVGELHPIKGQDIFINYVQSLSSEIKNKLEIQFIGRTADSAFKEKVEKLAISLNTEFIGQLSHKDVLNKVNEADIFALFSRGDSFSYATVEAMMLDKKIIISENVGVKYIIENENCGYIVKNQEDFTEKITKLVLNKTNELTSSRKAYTKYFSEENYSKKVKNIIEKLTEKKWRKLLCHLNLKDKK